MPNEHAVKEWNRLGAILVTNRLLTEAGITIFGMVCALHGKLVQMWASGETPTGHIMAQYRSMVNDFGLTPAAQSKVKPFGKEDEDNPFARNGKPRMVS
jgi:phage terminase small subunit